MGLNSFFEKAPLFFDHSLDFLRKKSPLLAHRLACAPSSPLSFCKTSSGEINLCAPCESLTHYYHAPTSAMQEAREWLDSLDLEGVSTLFVYGVGLGYYYDAAKKWLKSNSKHALIFLENDLNVLGALLQTERGLHLLQDPQVEIAYIEGGSPNDALLNEISWPALEGSFLFSVLPLYEKCHGSFSRELQAALFSHISRKKVIASEYFSGGLPFFSNFYTNLLQLPSAHLGSGLFGKFQNIPAIVCAAGPSLSSSLSLLRKLEGKALLIAGGSALNALVPEGIIPDFAAAVDPFPSQYSRLAVTEPFKIPCFYRGRLFKEALNILSGKRLYLNGGGGYDLPLWFEEELGIEAEELDAGFGVLNLSLSIAHALGCNPIFLVGCDLGLIEGAHYAKEVTENLSSQESSMQKHPNTLLRINVHGELIETLPKWVEEAAWISRFAKKNKELQLINCTENGLKIDEVPYQPFSIACENLSKNPAPKIPSIEELIAPFSLAHLSTEKIVSLLQHMQESLERILALLPQLIDELEKFGQAAVTPPKEPSKTDLKRVEEDKRERLHFASKEEAHLSSSDACGEIKKPLSLSLLESDLEMEIGYTYLLRLFAEFFNCLHHRTFQASETARAEGDWFQAKAKLVSLEKERALFLFKVSKINQELIIRALDPGRDPNPL